MQYLKEDVKNRIVQAAKRQFKDNGYKNTSMRDIAKEAGIVSGNIYRYFENKEQLYNYIVEPILAAFKEFDITLGNQYLEIVESSEYQARLTIIKKLLNYFVDTLDDHYYELIIFLKNTDNVVNAKYLKQFENVFLGTLNKIFLIKSREIDESDFKMIMKMIATSFSSGVICLLHEDYDRPKILKKRLYKFANVMFENMPSEI